MEGTILKNERHGCHMMIKPQWRELETILKNERLGEEQDTGLVFHVVNV